MRWYALILIGIAFTSVSLAGAATGPADLTFKVDSTADLPDVKLADGKCVASNGKCTLRAALNEVSSMKSKGQPVLIVLAKEDYNLELEPPAAATLDENGGDLDLFSHDTPPPSVTIQGGGAGDTTISQLRGDRVLELSAPEPVTITGVTITGGSVVNQGGGIANSEPGGLTLTNSEITGNSAAEGGGIYSRRPIKIDGTIISDNHATGAGGGIAMNTFGGQLSSTTVLGNTAGLLGGGIWLQNTDLSLITRSRIMGNSVSQTAVTGAPPAGGGIEVDTDPHFGATTLQLTYSTIQGNVALGPGGGIFWQATGTLLLDSSLVALNTAESGAGISTGPGPSTAAVGTVQLTNTTLSGNAAERGGAIERSTGNTLLRAVTMANNSASRGSGILFIGARAGLFDRERADHGEPPGEPELRAQHRRRRAADRRLAQRPGREPRDRYELPPADVRHVGHEPAARAAREQRRADADAFAAARQPRGRQVHGRRVPGARPARLQAAGRPGLRHRRLRGELDPRDRRQLVAACNPGRDRRHPDADPVRPALEGPARRRLPAVHRQAPPEPGDRRWVLRGARGPARRARVLLVPP